MEYLALNRHHSQIQNWVTYTFPVQNANCTHVVSSYFMVVTLLPWETESWRSWGLVFFAERLSISVTYGSDHKRSISTKVSFQYHFNWLMPIWDARFSIISETWSRCNSWLKSGLRYLVEFDLYKTPYRNWVCEDSSKEAFMWNKMLGKRKRWAYAHIIDLFAIATWQMWNSIRING